MSNIAIFNSIMGKKEQRVSGELVGISQFSEVLVLRIAVWQTYFSEWSKYLFIKDKLWVCDSWQWMCCSSKTISHSIFFTAFRLMSFFTEMLLSTCGSRKDGKNRACTVFGKYYLWLHYKTIFSSHIYDTDTWDLKDVLKSINLKIFN